MLELVDKFIQNPKGYVIFLLMAYAFILFITILIEYVSFSFYFLQFLIKVLNKDISLEKKQSNIEHKVKIFVMLIITIVTILANNNWIFIIYLFIVGPVISSESYLIQLIKSWKTSRKEESYKKLISNITLSDKAPEDMR